MLKIIVANPHNDRNAVEILFDMVRRNLIESTRGEFICYTDDTRKYTSGITIKPIADLYDRNEEDQYFEFCLWDVPVGSLDELVIFDGYYINTQMIQEKLPNEILNYTDTMTSIPFGAKIIMFPSPVSEYKNNWLSHVWKLGGGTANEIQFHCNTAIETILENVDFACKLPYQHLTDKDKYSNKGPLIICGGGPSIAFYISDIRRQQLEGATVWALNNTYQYLFENGIFADGHVMLDAREENAEFVPTRNTPKKYYASQCHPKVFGKGGDITIWHRFMDEIMPVLQKNGIESSLVGSGTTVGINAIPVAYLLGYREISLYGYDSSYMHDKNHAYEQKINENERIIEVKMNGKKFQASPWMVRQVEEFRFSINSFLELGMVIHVIGTGLLPYAAELINNPPIHDKFSNEPWNGETEIVELMGLGGHVRGAHKINLDDMASQIRVISQPT